MKRKSFNVSSVDTPRNSDLKQKAVTELCAVILNLNWTMSFLISKNNQELIRNNQVAKFVEESHQILYMCGHLPRQRALSEGLVEETKEPIK